MKQTYFIGIDISKSKLDCAVINAQMELLIEKEIKSGDQHVKAFLNGILKQLKADVSEILVCCENTGIYGRPLERVCQALGIDLWVEQALKIKRASTDMRGKNDRKDAIRIAEYAARYQDKKVLYEEPSETVKELTQLIKVRETLIAQKVAIQNQLRESESHDKEAHKVLKEGFKSVLKSIVSSIAKTEEKIEQLSKKEASIAENLALIKSIPGIGNQSALSFIVATNNFKTFHSAKQLACYAGVVPFQNQSGTVIKRERVSKLANMKIKSLLHMAAMCACRFDQELKEYYIRKVKEGKNKMSVLNAIRNKLVHRIMAVIQRRTPYVKMNELSYQDRNNSACILT